MNNKKANTTSQKNDRKKLSGERKDPTAWKKLEQISRKIQKAWKSEKSAAELISENRQ